MDKSGEDLFAVPSYYSPSTLFKLLSIQAAAGAVRSVQSSEWRHDNGIIGTVLRTSLRQCHPGACCQVADSFTENWTPTRGPMLHYNLLRAQNSCDFFSSVSSWQEAQAHMATSIQESGRVALADQTGALMQIAVDTDEVTMLNGLNRWKTSCL